MNRLLTASAEALEELMPEGDLTDGRDCWIENVARRVLVEILLVECDLHGAARDQALLHHVVVKVVLTSAVVWLSTWFACG